MAWRLWVIKWVQDIGSDERDRERESLYVAVACGIGDCEGICCGNYGRGHAQRRGKVRGAGGV